jgi:hypothetical protein
MKKYLLILFVIFTSVNSLKSQTYDLITARDGYTALINGVDGLKAGADLIAVQGMYYPGTAFDLNILDGTTSLWLFNFKSKDTSDHTLYIYIVFSVSGQYGFQLQEDKETDARVLQTLSDNWLNTDKFAAEITKNTELFKFHNDNSTLIAQEMMILMNDNESKIDNWVAMILLIDEDMMACRYNATTLEFIECKVPSSVSELLSKSTLLFPNPANNFINIELPFSGEINLKIYDINGNIVKTQNMNTDGKIMLNTSDMNVGVYNAVINGSGNTISKKVIIAR